MVDLGRPRIVATSVTPHSGVSAVKRPSTVPVRAIVFSKAASLPERSSAELRGERSHYQGTRRVGPAAVTTAHGVVVGSRQ